VRESESALARVRERERARARSRARERDSKGKSESVCAQIFLCLQESEPVRACKRVNVCMRACVSVCKCD